MKYLTVAIVVILSLFFYTTHSAKNSLEYNTNIHVQVKGLSSDWIYLHNVHENVKAQIDSAFMDEQGNAYFKRQDSLAPGFYTLILPDSSVIEMLIDKDLEFTLATTYPNLIQSMQVEGSIENEVLYKSLKYDVGMSEQFQAEIQQLQASGSQEITQEVVNQIQKSLFAGKEAQLAQLYQQYPNTLFTKYQMAQEPPKALLNQIMADQSIQENERTYLMLDHFWDNVDFSDTRLLNTPVIFNRLHTYFYEYSPNQTLTKLRAIDVLMNKVASHPDYYQFFAVWIAESYQPEKESKIDQEALYVHMVDNYLTYERAFWTDSVQVYAWQLRAGDKAKSLVGKPAQNIEAAGPDGKTRALYDIEAPYVAIFFYHAECDHCQKTAPKLAEFYQTWKNRGVEVYAVSMDTPEKEWKEFLVEHNMQDMVNVTDEGKHDIYSNYYVLGTPYIYLLNPERTIIGKDLQVEDLPRFIARDQYLATAQQNSRK